MPNDPSGNSPPSFPVACLGASAGGLEAYKSILKALPDDPGVALVIVNHQRKYQSQLYKILPKYTRMPLEIISDGMRLEVNHVYVIPSNCELVLDNGAFHLREVSKSHGWSNVITIFLESLAHEWRSKAIAVILSGLDADGSD